VVSAPPPRALTAERVYQALRERILGGEILPGMHLVEAELTAEYRVSRGTVREGLRRLSFDDLVELIPHRGARVRRLTHRDVEELYVVREAVESVAARLAATGPREFLAVLRAIHAEAEGLTPGHDRIKLVRLNYRFHSTVAEMAGNRTLYTVIRRLNTPMIGYQFVSALDAIDIATSQRHHAQILAALAARDAERAEAAMHRHMEWSRQSVVRAIAPSAPVSR
jgi:DNA-binding GntR family transcriptional regulator